MNMNQVTIEELRTLIPTIAETLTPVIQSEAGCGKTSLLKMIEQDLGDKYDYVYVDCPVKDMSDIAMTIPNHATKTLENYNGSIFKLESPKPKIILLDEFMKAPKLLQVIFTRLMLERSVGETPLPKGSMVFATSNNQSDGLGDGMLAHAGNRLCIMRMKKPDHKSWLQWANNNGVSVKSLELGSTNPGVRVNQPWSYCQKTLELLSKNLEVGSTNSEAMAMHSVCLFVCG